MFFLFKKMVWLMRLRVFSEELKHMNTGFAKCLQ